MTTYLVDTYAWVEYLIGSRKGEKMRTLFAGGGHSFLTVECCLAELYGWALKNDVDIESALRVVRANSTIVRINEQDWIAAGKIRFTQRETQKDFGLIDSVLLVKQHQIGCSLISGDLHFKSKPNVVFLD